MKSIINFWKHDTVNKMIVLVSLALVGGLVFILHLVLTAPAESTLSLTLFQKTGGIPTPILPAATATRLPTPTTAFFPSLTPPSSAGLPQVTLALPARKPTPVPLSVTPPAAGAPSVSCIPANPREGGSVVNVIDGNTVKVYMQGKVYVVRYIGIAVDDVDQPYSQAAITMNSSLVFAKKVSLIKDVSDKDSFGRLLRYVIVGNTFVNFELVHEGLATAAQVPPDTACSQVLQNAQLSAQQAQVGRWATTPTPAPSSP